MSRPKRYDRRGSPQTIRTRILRERAERKEDLRQAALGMAAAGRGMETEERIPWWHVQARRIWAQFPDRRTLTGILCGDPIYERSALARVTG